MNSTVERASAEEAAGARHVPWILTQLEELIAGVALVVVVLAVCWGVLSRYVTAQPAPWAGEVAGIAFAWVVFMGAAAGFKRGQHVSIDLLVMRLPAALRRLIGWAIDLLLLAFAAYVTWLAVWFTFQNWGNPTSVLRLPYSVVYAAVALGFLSITLHHVANLLGRLRRPMP